MVAGPGDDAELLVRGAQLAGATTTGTRWALAEGEVGGPSGLETYVLIANTSATAGSAKVTLHFEDGTTAERDVPAAGEQPDERVGRAGLSGCRWRRSSASSSRASGPTPAQIVVERAMYSSAGGVVWAAGTQCARHAPGTVASTKSMEQRVSLH